MQNAKKPKAPLALEDKGDDGMRMKEISVL